MQQGDDLENDFVIDEDLVALSGEEDAGLDGGFFSDGADEGNDWMSGEEDDAATGDTQTPVAQSSADAVALKKRKRREKEKEKKTKVCVFKVFC